jgi:hypothetical protein
MMLPGGGVGVEMVRRLRGLGSDGDSHAVVNSAVAITPTIMRIPVVGMDLIITRR